MRDLFPENAVAFFVSYYDYYQPEAYIPTTDTYIEKDAIINDQIDRMRHAATHALLSRPRRDHRRERLAASTASVRPRATTACLIEIVKGEELRRDELLRRLVDIQYERNDVDFHRGTFRVRGDVVEIFPAYEEATAIRIEFFGDEVETISEVDPMRGRVLESARSLRGLPRLALRHAAPAAAALRSKRSAAELRERLDFFDKEGRFLEKQRVEQRTHVRPRDAGADGFRARASKTTRGISRTATQVSRRRRCIDYFPEDFLLVIDESHQTVPQIGAMYRGDRSRKETLVDYGFRLPSALDNRPLQVRRVREVHGASTIFVSATPGDYELERPQGVVVEQLIRPTGLIDPASLRAPRRAARSTICSPKSGSASNSNERVLVTTLTKRMAEDLTEYYAELGVRVRYLHSDVETLERIEHFARSSRRRVRRAGRHQPACAKGWICPK